MDFTTRDRYRHVIEHLANKSRRLEVEVASTTLQLAKAIADTKGDSNNIDYLKRSHIGFYLIDAGLPQLQKALGIHPGFFETVRNWSQQRTLFAYLGVIGLVVFGLTGILLVKASQSAVNWEWLIVLSIVLIISISQASLALVNWIVSLLVQPHPLPKMDFTKEIPPSLRTLVVVPTMLCNEAQIESLVEALEVRFLGNRDNHLHFALLTDFNDAKQEHLPDDAKLLALAKEKIIDLNQRSRSVKTKIFSFVASSKALE